MREYSFVTVDVFTEARFGGNPLAVFPEAAGISGEEMQQLAREFNWSEITFVLPPEDPAHTAQVRIFNPAYEMPFAGHPNVGTAYVLAQLGRSAGGGRMVFEELAGLVEVELERGASGEVAAATINAPEPLSVTVELPASTIARCAGLMTEDIIVAAHPPVVASVGHPFVFAEVGRAALTRALADAAAFREAVEAMPALGGRLSLHLYARDGDRIATRMFAPLANIPEDPATGSANATLGALLLSLGSEEKLSLDVVQGVEMGRPSALRVKAWRGPGGAMASVGGSCVPVFTGKVQL